MPSRHDYRIVTEYTNTRTLDQLVSRILDVHGKCTVVIDARWSTKYPMDGRFYPERLGDELRRKGIRYFYYHDLGNPDKDMTNIDEMESAYKARVITLPAFRQIVEMIRGSSDVFCLICYCAPPRRCHRLWLRECLLNALDGE